MKIKILDAGKRYRQEWILRSINLELESGQAYAITGPNGSGKSTLLKMLSGHLSLSRGTIQYEQGGKLLPVEQVYAHLALAAPYVELIEEFTLWEALTFHGRFRAFRQGLQVFDLVDLLAFPKAAHKPIRHFSSGMKQRLKLALALCSEADFILLDEPSTNLDRQGMEWYQRLLAQFAGQRLLVIASNVEEDYQYCTEHIDILQYKNRQKPAP